MFTHAQHLAEHIRSENLLSSLIPGMIDSAAQYAADQQAEAQRNAARKKSIDPSKSNAAVSAENRAKVINAINSGTFNLLEIAERSGLSRETVKAHCRAMLNSGLVEKIRSGRRTTWRQSQK